MLYITVSYDTISYPYIQKIDKILYCIINCKLYNIAHIKQKCNILYKTMS